MNKLGILRKMLTVIQGPLPVADKPISDTPVDDHREQPRRKAVNSREDTAEEQAVKKLARDFAKALTDRDFEHMDGRAEYYLYTVDHLVELIKNNDEQNTINLFNEYKIKSKYEDCEFLSLTISADQEQAVVDYDVKTSVLSADDKYFKELNKNTSKKNRISKGTPFNTTYTLLVKKEKGTWKVDNFEAAAEN